MPERRTEQAECCGLHPRANLLATPGVDDDVAAHRYLLPDIEETFEALDAHHLSMVAKQIHGDAAMWRKELTHAAQERLAESSPGQLLPTKEIDRDIVEPLLAR